MAPAVVIDNTPDFGDDFQPAKHVASPRTLLLAPPTVASQPATLAKVVEAHDRTTTDIHMLDRLSLGLVSLPASTYDLVLLIADSTQHGLETAKLLDRSVMASISGALKVGGKLQAQDGSLGSSSSAPQTEAILAGLVSDGANSMVKPDPAATQTVKLSFGKRKTNPAASTPAATGADFSNLAKRKSTEPDHESAALGIVRATPAGVGFVDMNNDFEGGYDDGSGYDEEVDDYFPSNDELQNAEKIDPSSLLSEEDKQRPIVIPEACKPNSKRRRACKDCTCGLAERLNAEDKAKRANADAELAKLKVNDLTELDFTVQGKVGSCGNCALGDAFRCDGCPYIGLPAFKPGEEVRLLNNDIQL